MNDNLMIQVCMKYIVIYIYDLSLFLITLAFYVTMKGQFVSSSGLYFIKKMHRKSYDLSVYLMTFDLLYFLVKFSHELEDIMVIKSMTKPSLAYYQM